MERVREEAQQPRLAANSEMDKDWERQWDREHHRAAESERAYRDRDFFN